MWPDEIGSAHEPAQWPYYAVASVALVILLALTINTLFQIYQRMSPDLRNLSAWQIWLSLTPTFGAIWIFYVIWQAAHAMSDEFKRKQIIEFETFPGLGIGWAYAFFSATAQLTLLIDEPVITLLLYIVAVILLVIFWTKLIGFRNKLDGNMFHTFNQNIPPSPPFPPYADTQQWNQPQTTNQPPPVYPAPASQQPYQPQQDDLDRWKPKQ